MPSPAALLACLAFGVVVLAAFAVGRRRGNGPHLGIGLALMVYPYFVSETWLLYAIGFALCGALYFWRD
jgi:hypothetical protein